MGNKFTEAYRAQEAKNDNSSLKKINGEWTELLKYNSNNLLVTSATAYENGTIVCNIKDYKEARIIVEESSAENIIHINLDRNQSNFANFFYVGRNIDLNDSGFMREYGFDLYIWNGNLMAKNGKQIMTEHATGIKTLTGYDGIEIRQVLVR